MTRLPRLIFKSTAFGLAQSLSRPERSNSDENSTSSVLRVGGDDGSGAELRDWFGPCSGQEAEYRIYHGRRCGSVEHRRLSPWHGIRQDAEHRPVGPAGHAVYRLLCRSKLHGGQGELYHGADPIADGPHDGGASGRGRGDARSGLHDRDGTAISGVCNGTVWQEPSGRLEQIPADTARLRRVSRISVSPRRAVRSVLVLVPERSGVPRQVWSAECASLLGNQCR